MISALLLTIKNWKLVVFSFIALAFAGMWGMLTLRTKQLEEATDKNDTYELEDEIRIKQDKATEIILDEEKEEIIEVLHANAKLSLRERADKL